MTFISRLSFFYSTLCSFYWDLRLDKLSKFSTKTMIAAEDVESKYSIELKNQE